MEFRGGSCAEIRRGMCHFSPNSSWYLMGIMRMNLRKKSLPMFGYGNS
jgi:hypothetical protein